MLSIIHFWSYYWVFLKKLLLQFLTLLYFWVLLLGELSWGTLEICKIFKILRRVVGFKARFKNGRYQRHAIWGYRDVDTKLVKFVIVFHFWILIRHLSHWQNKMGNHVDLALLSNRLFVKKRLNELGALASNRVRFKSFVDALHFAVA
jgi:hypothetical protein